jgi:RNA polymerase sigma factor (sigma-70 family)
MLAAPDLASEFHAKSYLRKTIENLCIDIFRREGRRPSLVVLDEANEEIANAVNVNQDLSSSMSAAEDASIIRQAISMLSPAERTALVMWEIDKRSTKEIALSLGIKESTVRHTVARARSSLRKILTELVVDSSKGITAMDLLSISIRKASKAARKSSKVALSILFLVLAIQVQFKSPFFNSDEEMEIKGKMAKSNSVLMERQRENVEFVSQESPGNSDSEKKKNSANVDKSGGEISQRQLNGSVVPTGFTIGDSSGAIADAYFNNSSARFSGADSLTTQIFKTVSGAANIFIMQKLEVGKGGLSYLPVVAFGRDGQWIPLKVEVSDTKIKRIAGGDFVLDVQIEVQSEVETPLRIASSARGQDLSEAPTLLLVRLLLDSSKTQVLAQSVFVETEELGA